MDKPSPVIVHVFDLPFDKAVDSFAVRPVGEPAHHSQPVGPLVPGEQLLHRNRDLLPSLLAPVDAQHFLL